MQHILPPIFQGWKDKGRWSDALCRFGSDSLFDMQVLRHIQEYAAPLIFKKQPTTPPSADLVPHFLIGVHKKRLYLEKYGRQICVYDTESHRVVSTFLWPQIDREKVGDVGYYLSKVCQDQVWCVTHFDHSGPQLDIHTLEGESLARYFLPGDGGYMMDFAFHPLLSQLMVACNSSLIVYSWPQLQVVFQIDSENWIWDRLFPHPSAPLWFALKYSISGAYSHVISIWSAEGQCMKEMQWPDEKVMYSCELYRRECLLITSRNLMTVLSFDLKVLETIPLGEHQDCGLLADETTGQFYWSRQDSIYRYFESYLLTGAAE